MKDGLRIGVVFIALTTSTAMAAELSTRNQSWSIYAGNNVGTGDTVLEATAGWPGLGVGILHGMSERLDLGARFTFNYSPEGATLVTVPGVKLQGIARLHLLDTGRINLGLRFEPGFLAYFYQGLTAIGISIPAGLALGIPISPAFMLHFGFEMPFYFTFGDLQSVVLPIFAGGGFEYFVDRNLNINMKLRMGPVIGISTSFGGAINVPTGTSFGLIALIGVAYKF